MKLTLPPKTRKLVEDYLQMRFGQTTIACPYFQNIQGRWTKAVFEGKGLPQEIKAETLNLFRKNHKNTSTYEPHALRYNMVMAGIGIDCSGFVVRVLDSLLREKGMGGIRENTKPQNFSLLNYLRHYLRTFTNLSADSISSDTNCINIDGINEARSGDILREGFRHVAVITEVDIKGGKVTKITYCHSTWDYDEDSGVRKGSIKILDSAKPLGGQNWEEYFKGRNWMYEDFLKSRPDDRGIRRLKALQVL